jgi:hypothetical protein
MSDVLRQTAVYGNRDTVVLFDDFLAYTTAYGNFSSLAADTNSTVAADADGVGGILEIKTGDASDNNEAGVLSTNEIFLPAPGKPMCFETRIQFTDTNNAVNVAAGFADVFGAANTVVDNGASIVATFYGAMIYKLDGGTVWRCATSAGAISSTGTDTISTTTAGGSSYQTLRIDVSPISGLYNASEVTFFVDGVQLRDTNNQPIVHTLTHAAAGTGDGNCGAYIKAGEATANMTLSVDYIYCAQKRTAS